MVSDVTLRIANRTTLLAGALNGSRDLPWILDHIGSVRGAVLLDFEGCSALSGSYFRTALAPLWAIDRIFPSVSNVGDLEEDLQECLAKRNLNAWNVDTASPVVELDPALETCVKAVLERGSATAPDLAESADEIGRTAWNNRLKSLHEMRLLAIERNGRSNRYVLPWGKPAWE